MAKTKHQKLADAIKLMLKEIGEHQKKVEQQLDMVQFYLSEKVLISGRPLMPPSKLKNLMDTHRLGLIQLSPNQELQRYLKEKPLIGMIVGVPPEIKPPVLPRQTIGWFIPWRLSIVLPHENSEKLNQMHQQALLYCPIAKEMSRELHGFEGEDAAASLTHQLLTAIESDRRLSVVRTNLLADPFPIWEESIKMWRSIPSEDTDPDDVSEVAVSPQDLDRAGFAPKAGLSLALAYEKVMKSIRTRQSKHRHSLRKIYKKKIEEKIFDNVPWSEEKKDSFLRKWQSRFFDENKKIQQANPGRWKQCECVSRETAARLIEYFVNEFIFNPANKKAGEVACVLWILIWIAQQDKSDQVTLKKVLNLSSKNLKPGKIIVGKIEITISWGLHHFLDCLCGQGEGTRTRRLFENLDLHGKALERALLHASKVVLGENEIPVMPGAFLGFPLLHPDQRMPIAQRQAMRRDEPIVPLRHTHTEVKKALLEASKASK